MFKYPLPLPYAVTASFGFYGSRMHVSTAYRSERLTGLLTPVYALCAGSIGSVNSVLVDTGDIAVVLHANTRQDTTHIYYAGMQDIRVVTGQQVEAGDILGYVSAGESSKGLRMAIRLNWLEWLDVEGYLIRMNAKHVKDNSVINVKDEQDDNTIEVKTKRTRATKAVKASGTRTRQGTRSNTKDVK